MVMHIELGEYRVLQDFGVASAPDFKEVGRLVVTQNASGGADEDWFLYGSGLDQTYSDALGNNGDCRGYRAPPAGSAGQKATYRFVYVGTVSSVYKLSDYRGALGTRRRDPRDIQAVCSKPDSVPAARAPRPVPEREPPPECGEGGLGPGKEECQIYQHGYGTYHEVVQGGATVGYVIVSAGTGTRLIEDWRLFTDPAKPCYSAPGSGGGEYTLQFRVSTTYPADGYDQVLADASGPPPA